MITTIWHNPRCSKSRLTLSLLEEQGIEPTVRQYLDDAPSTDELRIVINQLDMTPWDLLRRGEKVFKELDLTKESSDAAIISAMTENPILIERPVVIHGNGAALGRPPENILTLLD
ncbi:MAG: arsenate reductase (glutaredoxin) [Luminiphilus sp.]|jgi:arsenate reductase (glutaredoxin)|nr:arsenate reductase (glutaredoxin) [Luminiphilus sp.]